MSLQELLFPKNGRLFFLESAANAIGKTMRFENTEELKITAVFDNIPANSSLQFDFLRTWTDFVKQNDWVHNWGNTDPQTFIQLKSHADAAKVQRSGNKRFYL